MEGAPRLLARDVGSPPWVGDTLVAYALEVDDAAELRMWRDGVETTLARGLASAGAFRLGPEGARIAGVESGAVRPVPWRDVEAHIMRSLGRD